MFWKNCVWSCHFVIKTCCLCYPICFNKVGQKSGAKLKCFGGICVGWSCHSVTLLSKLVAATQSDIASGNNKCLKLTSNSIIFKIKWGKISPGKKETWSRLWLLPSSQVNEFFTDQVLSVCWKLLKPDLDFHKILF